MLTHIPRCGCQHLCRPLARSSAVSVGRRCMALDVFSTRLRQFGFVILQAFKHRRVAGFGRRWTAAQSLDVFPTRCPVWRTRGGTAAHKHRENDQQVFTTHNASTSGKPPRILYDLSSVHARGQHRRRRPRPKAAALRRNCPAA